MEVHVKSKRGIPKANPKAKPKASGGGWITSGTTCRGDNCQGRTRKTGLNGGVS